MKIDTEKVQRLVDPAKFVENTKAVNTKFEPMQRITGVYQDYGLDTEFEEGRSSNKDKLMLFNQVEVDLLGSFKNKSLNDLEFIYPQSNSDWNFIPLLKNELLASRNWQHTNMIGDKYNSFLNEKRIGSIEEVTAKLN